MLRWWYAIKMGWRHRNSLKRYLVDNQRQVQDLRSLTQQRLEQSDIAILILDFDGVLGGHDAQTPLPEAERWLKQLSQTIGEQRLALFTNKPKAERLAYFRQNFPSLYIVHSVPKKPYPDGILQVAEYKGVPPHRVALLDDRLLTGMLSVCLAYSQGFYFCKPYQNFLRHPMLEFFFSLLRGFERCLIKMIGTVK